MKLPAGFSVRLVGRTGGANPFGAHEQRFDEPGYRKDVALNQIVACEQ